VAKGDGAKAKDFISQSLQQKKNYTDAIFLLAQVQVAEGNLKDAITSVEAATLLSPTDSGAFFQLGLLRYNVNDIQGAASAFEQAIAINPSYANAKYFLGLSYNRLGRNKEAIAQFQDLKTTNPDNKEVDLILQNLTAGKSPFTNATPPIDNKPEKRSTPPVQEKPASKTSTAGSLKSSDSSPAVDTSF
jgi:tetratricopeptide (TPR) repeat protein